MFAEQSKKEGVAQAEFSGAALAAQQRFRATLAIIGASDNLDGPGFGYTGFTDYPIDYPDQCTDITDETDH